MKSGDKSSKISAVASDGVFWVSKVLSTIQTLEKDAKHVALLSEADDEEVALRDKALGIAARLKSVSALADGYVLLILKRARFRSSNKSLLKGLSYCC